MGSSENVPVPGDGPGAGQERQRGRALRTRRWLRRRAKPLRRGVLLFIMVLVVEYLVVPELVGASKDLYLLGQINAVWVSAGVVLEGLSLFCYAVLTKVLLPAKAHKPSLWVLFRIDLSAAAVAHVIPAGTLGTAALGYKLFTDEGISGNDATVMMAAKGIGSTVVLNVLLWVSLVVSIPLAGFQPIYGTVAIIGTVVLLGVAALVLGVTRGAGLASRLLRALGDKLPFVSGEQVERAVLDAAKSFSLLARDKRVMAWALLWASLNWILDAASLWCFVAAFGHFANPFELFAAYGIANVAGALPLTPGGLGVVDSITPLLLVGFGVTRSVATLGVLGWRMVNFWLPIPTGALAYVSLKVTPDSGMRAMRSALPGLFSGRGGRDVVGDMPKLPEVIDSPKVPGSPQVPAVPEASESSEASEVGALGGAAADDGAVPGGAGSDGAQPGGAGSDGAQPGGAGSEGGAAPDGGRSDGAGRDGAGTDWAGPGGAGPGGAGLGGSPNGDSAGKPAGPAGNSRAESPAEKRSR